MTGEAADLRVLTEYRDQLLNERTATANRVQTDLGGCGPATSTTCRTRPTWRTCTPDWSC